MRDLQTCQQTGRVKSKGQQWSWPCCGCLSLLHGYALKSFAVLLGSVSITAITETLSTQASMFQLSCL